MDLFALFRSFSRTAAALLIGLTLILSACSSGGDSASDAPDTTEPEPASVPATEASDEPEISEDEVAPPEQDDPVEPPVDTEPPNEPSEVVAGPGGEYTAEAEPFCTAYVATLGPMVDNNPDTAEEAESMLGAVTDGMDEVVSLSPEPLTEGAAATQDFVETVAREAASREWEPAFFDELNPDLLVSFGVDTEAVAEFFDGASSYCQAAEI